MARKSSAPSVQLFPFLAVLLCAMGALILLLMVMSKKLRERAVDAELARQSISRPAIPELEPEPPSLPHVVTVTPEPVVAPTPVITGPSREERAARRTQLLAEQAAARQRQQAREADWQRQLEELEATRLARLQALEQAQQTLTASQQKLKDTSARLRHFRERLARQDQLTKTEDQQRGVLITQEIELGEQIAAERKKLAELEKGLRSAESKFTLIPYDGQLGTTRRPIYIECTEEGCRFWPENVLLDAQDLQGFTETYNPLLSGVQSLSIYWLKKAARSPDGSPQKPYVLLLVRPGGTVAYYVARKMLTRFSQPFGYELVEEDLPLQFPEVDPTAKRELETAIAQALRHRAEASSIAIKRPGEIEFETFDSGAMATKNRQDSPFRGGGSGLGGGVSPGRSGTGSGTGREVTISNSPLRNADVLPPRTASALPGSSRPGKERPNGSALGDSQADGPGGFGNSKLPDDAEFADLSSGGRIPEGARPGYLREIGPGSAPPQSRTAPSATGGADSPLIPPPGTSGSGNELTMGPYGEGDPLGNDSLGNSQTGKSPRGSDRPGDGTNGSPARPLLVIDEQGDPTGQGNGPRAGTPSAPSASGSPGGSAATRSPSASTFSNSPGSGSSSMIGAGAPTGPQRYRPPMPSSDKIPTHRKRDLGKIRWGGNPQASLGFEREVKIVVQSDKLVVGSQQTSVPASVEAKKAEILEGVLDALDLEAITWGEPPTKFYWIPYVRFEIHPGGELHHERLHGALREWGVFSEVGERVTTVSKESATPTKTAAPTGAATRKATTRAPHTPKITPKQQ